MKNRALSLICAWVLVITGTLSGLTVSAADRVLIISYTELTDALQDKSGTKYALDNDILAKSCGITANADIDGAGHAFRCLEKSANALVYQNENVSSRFSNLTINGREKGDVGIWLGTGKMTYNSCSITGFEITSGRFSAIAAASSSSLVLNDTDVNSNSKYDIGIYDSASLTINSGSSMGSVYVDNNFTKINIGADWSGSFEISMKTPTVRKLGTVDSSADISGITVANEGYYVINDNGALVVTTDRERAIRFDMSQRDMLYKGSTGFLYGESEINVPSIDLLQGLKPDTMVQKAVGGLQHPTGDAVRNRSALLSAGVRDMQVYFQDIYLEWPYDAPMINGEIDLNSYQKKVEKILYATICERAKAGDSGAFKGSDGKYYVLDDELSKQYSYVLFNEPDQIWYGGNLEGLEKAWKKIYNAVHAVDPDARCVGPNFSGFNADSYNHFLEYCYNNNCLPEIISWHELGDISLTDFYAHYDCVKAAQSKYYTDDYAAKSGRSYQPELMVNEYARHYDIGSPGGLVKWLSMFEDKDMSGCMAYWAMANSLNEMAADQNSPTSTWWVYHWYAQMTGKQCPLTSPAFNQTRFYGVSSYDESENMAYVLFGGSEDENGAETVYLDEMDATDLVNANGLVNVKIYGVGFSGQQGANYSPSVVFDGAVQTEYNSLKLTVDSTDEMEAYFAVITKAEDNAEPSNTTAKGMPTISYEAEDATLLGSATAYDKIGWTSFATSGRADVGSIWNIGDGVQFNVTVPESANYDVSLFYSLQAPFVNPKTLVPDANGQNRGIGKTLPFGVQVDDNPADKIYLESTVTWLYKNHCDMELYLTAGEHTITFTQIHSNEAGKGNLQLTAALDKLDLVKIEDASTKNDFEIDLTEMSNFKTESGYRITAIAPEAGYYTVTSDGDISLAKQCVDYAADAKTYSQCAVYDVPVSNTVYLSQGANTLLVTGSAAKLAFHFGKDITDAAATTINASDMTLHGNSPVLKRNSYAESKAVISELGVGQKPKTGDSGKYNYATFKVNADSEGVYNLAVRYTNDEPAPVMLKSNGDTYIHPYNIDLVERYAQIAVNGGEPETVYFKNTMSWDTFKTVDVQVKLNAGVNTIKIYNDNSYQFSTLVNATAPEMDTIKITKLSYNGSAVAKVAGADSVKHSYKVTTKTQKATAKANGKIVKTYTCTQCGYKYATTKIIYAAKTIVLSGTKYVYNGKVKKPTVIVKNSKGQKISSSNYTVSYTKGRKYVGKYPVKITFKGNYSGSKTLYFTINPKATTLSSVKPKSRGFIVKWKKQATQTTGYQIQYSTSSKFKSAKTVTVGSYKTTSKTIGKLKAKKKYFVRVRTYRTVKFNGKNIKIYSTWSKAKAVTTQK